MADRSGYIGRAPSDSSVTIARQHYNPTGVQTDFTFNSGYTVGLIDAYLNGVKLIEGNDYTASDGSTVGLTTAAISLDTLELVAYKAFNLGFVNSSVADFNVGANLTVAGNATFNGTVTGATVGVSSAGTSIGNAKTLNFIGLGNTFAVEGDAVNISIAGGGGGGLGTALSDVKTDPGNQFYTTPRNITIATGTTFFAEASVGDGGVVFSKLGKIHVATGATVHIGSGTTLALDVLNIF
tara:strand:+ start:114 stop:830 length:717 start_codon:yes stop_codon:yes gene_type:complete